MTTGSAHPASARHPDTGVHIVTWIVGVLGIIAAAIGTWIETVEDGSTLEIFGRSWVVEDIDAFWGPTLLIAGGALAAIAMTTSAVRDRQHEASVWLVGVEAALAVLGIAAVAFGIFVLF